MAMNEPAREAMAQAARRHVVEEFSIEREAARINAVDEERGRG
jgi:hypothetical protein